MKKKLWHNTEHADAYLSSSVIRLGEDPIYVHRVYGDQISYWPLGKVGGRNKVNVVNLYHDEVNLNPVPLGMLATSESSKATCFLSRSPRRAWKQGLASSSLILEKINKDDKAKRIRFNKNDVLYSLSLKNTIKNKYIEADAAAKLSKEEDIPVAFGRRFAIWNGKIFYKDKGVPVGTWLKTGFQLNDEFLFLKEALLEDLNGKESY